MTRPADPDWSQIVAEISKRLGPERLQLAPVDTVDSGPGRHWSWVWPDCRLMIQRRDVARAWKVTVICPYVRITTEYQMTGPTLDQVQQMLVTAGVLFDDRNARIGVAESEVARLHQELDRLRHAIVRADEMADSYAGHETGAVMIHTYLQQFMEDSHDRG